MKVIKEGKIKPKTKKFKCRECGCIFEADENEYKLSSCRNEIIYEANCPYCKSYVYV